MESMKDIKHLLEVGDTERLVKLSGRSVSSVEKTIAGLRKDRVVIAAAIALVQERNEAYERAKVRIAKEITVRRNKDVYKVKRLNR